MPPQRRAGLLRSRAAGGAVSIDTNHRDVVDAARYRTVLGTVPTGVVVVTAVADGPDGTAGLTIGSFTSVSLAPPLVGFLPSKSSRSWARMAGAGSFCVNVLAADQVRVCHQFTGTGEKFAGIGWNPAGSGAPVLDGVLSWIDCDLDRIIDVGDHWFVIGRVLALCVVRTDIGPLVFLGGEFGSTEPALVRVSGGATSVRVATLTNPGGVP